MGAVRQEIEAGGVTTSGARRAFALPGRAYFSGAAGRRARRAIGRAVRASRATGNAAGTAGAAGAARLRGGTGPGAPRPGARNDEQEQSREQRPKRHAAFIFTRNKPPLARRGANRLLSGYVSTTHTAGQTPRRRRRGPEEKLSRLRARSAFLPPLGRVSSVAALCEPGPPRARSPSNESFTVQCREG